MPGKIFQNFRGPVYGERNKWKWILKANVKIIALESLSKMIWD